MKKAHPKSKLTAILRRITVSALCVWLGYAVFYSVIPDEWLGYLAIYTFEASAFAAYYLAIVISFFYASLYITGTFARLIASIVTGVATFAIMNVISSFMPLWSPVQDLPGWTQNVYTGFWIGVSYFVTSLLVLCLWSMIDSRNSGHSKRKAS